MTLLHNKRRRQCESGCYLRCVRPMRSGWAAIGPRRRRTQRQGSYGDQTGAAQGPAGSGSACSGGTLQLGAVPSMWRVRRQGCTQQPLSIFLHQFTHLSISRSIFHTIMNTVSTVFWVPSANSSTVRSDARSRNWRQIAAGAASYIASGISQKSGWFAACGIHPSASRPNRHRMPVFVPRTRPLGAGPLCKPCADHIHPKIYPRACAASCPTVISEPGPVPALDLTSSQKAAMLVARAALGIGLGIIARALFWNYSGPLDCLLVPIRSHKQQRGMAPEPYPVGFDAGAIEPKSIFENTHG